MRVFVLYRPERLARVERALADAGIVGAELVLGPWAGGVTVPSDCSLTPAEVACWQGHREIVTRAAGDLTLVLEDDFLPVSDWQARLADIISLADRPWDYINLGRYYTIPKVPAWPGVEDSFSLTTHAYLLSPEGSVRYGKQFADPRHFALDWLPMCLRMLGALRVYTAVPRLFTQDRTIPGLIHDNKEPPEYWPEGLARPDPRWL
jgi:GR25 family glycosyltransferase involved in LPS biosynthesis